MYHLVDKSFTNLFKQVFQFEIGFEDKRRKRRSKAENPEDEHFNKILTVAVDVIPKHPEPKFDELVAFWFGEDIHRKYKVNSKPIMRVMRYN